MFGTYRLILALLVLLKHFKSTEVFSGLAVWGFFLLSGFLITGILNTRYGQHRDGLIEFGINRALRLLPTYWMSVVLALASIAAFGSIVDPRAINGAFAFPQSAWEWIPAVFILGGSVLGLGRVENSPSPSAWAVEVEIFLYVISVWWLSRSTTTARRTTLACLMLFPLLWAASKWLLREGHAELAGSLTYSFVPAALLPYAAGAWLWHLRDRIELPSRIGPQLAIAAVGLAVCGAIVSRVSVTLAFLLSVPVFAYATLLLSRLSAGNGSRAVDTFFGHMSYPVYLMHWVGNYLALALAAMAGAGASMTVVDTGGLMQTTMVGFASVVLATLVIAGLVAALLEAPIERHRRSTARRWGELIARRLGPRAH